MTQDLLLHPETADSADLAMLGMGLAMAGALDTPAEIRRWVEGYG